MTPWRKESYRLPRSPGEPSYRHGPRRTSYWWWRAATLFALAVAAGAIALAPFLFKAVSNATEANRAFTCSIADLVTLDGNHKRPGSGISQAEHHQAELDFLRLIDAAHCEFITRHPRVEHQIDQAIKALERQLGDK